MVCPKCLTVYTVPETYELRQAGTKVCKTCGYIPLYKYPMFAQRKKCGSALLRIAKSSSRKECVYLIWPYCYKSVVQSVETIVKRPEFEENCEEWQKRKIPVGVLGDL